MRPPSAVPPAPLPGGRGTGLDPPAGGEVTAAAIRVLCVGAPRVADEALGVAAAGRLRLCLPHDVDLALADAAGEDLTGFLWDATRLIIVDAVTTGAAPPGTVVGMTEDDVRTSRLPLTPYTTLIDTLHHARQLGLAVPQEVVLVAVEAVDRMTLGHDMTPVVRAALPNVIEEVLALVDEWRKRE